MDHLRSPITLVDVNCINALQCVVTLSVQICPKNSTSSHRWMSSPSDTEVGIFGPGVRVLNIKAQLKARAESSLRFVAWICTRMIPSGYLT